MLTLKRIFHDTRKHEIPDGEGRLQSGRYGRGRKAVCERGNPGDGTDTGEGKSL